MIGRYKEIWYGIAMGLSMWVLDAMMHTSMHGELSSRALIREIFIVDATQIFFRTLFVIVSIAFGVVLWRSNQRRHQLQDMQAAIDAFQRQTINPLLLIVGYSRLLSLKEGWPISREQVEMIREIQINVEKVNEVINQLPPPGTPLIEMETALTNSASRSQRRLDY
jgi:hypothetical protein